MPKQTRKLLVYLDQNFLSAMAKADGDEEINPAFTEIYRLLHQGFVDEKLVVPSSVLHDIESSLATHLKDRIATYQGYLGQVRLRRPEEIWNRQTEVGLARFSGRATRDPLDPKLAFLDDPDQRVQRHGIRVDAHLESFNFRAARHRTAKGLEALRLRLLQEGIGYDQQLKVERQEQRDHFLRTYFRFCHPVSAEQRQRFTEYADTSEFLALPRLSIEARLYAAILTRKPTRAIKPSDATDIEIQRLRTLYGCRLHRCLYGRPAPLPWHRPGIRDRRLSCQGEQLTRAEGTSGRIFRHRHARAPALHHGFCPAAAGRKGAVGSLLPAARRCGACDGSSRILRNLRFR